MVSNKLFCVSFPPWRCSPPFRQGQGRLGQPGSRGEGSSLRSAMLPNLPARLRRPQRRGHPHQDVSVPRTPEESPVLADHGDVTLIPEVSRYGPSWWKIIIAEKIIPHFNLTNILFAYTTCLITAAWNKLQPIPPRGSSVFVCMQKPTELGSSPGSVGMPRLLGCCCSEPSWK